MHATVRRYPGNSALVDALLPHEAEVTQMLRDISGFRAYLLLRSGSGDAVSVSLYDDKRGAKASNAAAREWLAANLPDLAVAPPEVMAGEVAITAWQTSSG
jgi:hypothetical protein